MRGRRILIIAALLLMTVSGCARGSAEIGPIKVFAIHF